MFQRFTDRARRVVVLAQHEARTLDHDYIGTEHILLGLIDEGQGVATTALTSMGISLEEMRQTVQDTIGRGAQPPESGHIPFTPQAKKVLELSLRESMQLGHEYIGTEHILLALIREGGGAAQLLAGAGAGTWPASAGSAAAASHQACQFSGCPPGKRRSSSRRRSAWSRRARTGDSLASRVKWSPSSSRPPGRSTEASSAYMARSSGSGSQCSAVVLTAASGARVPRPSRAAQPGTR